MNEVTASFNIYIVVRQYDPGVGVTMRNVSDIFSERLKTFYEFMKDWSHISVGFFQCWVITVLTGSFVRSVKSVALSNDLNQQMFYAAIAVVSALLIAQPSVRSFFNPLIQHLRG